MPLPLVYLMNNLGQKHMYVDGENLIYQKDKSLVVEKGFMAEALKQVGQTLFNNRVMKELASYQKIVYITPEMRKARRGVKYAYVEKKEIEEGLGRMQKWEEYNAKFDPLKERYKG